jgi:epoxide hydrolase-like predicted phosphatase
LVYNDLPSTFVYTKENLFKRSSHNHHMKRGYISEKKVKAVIFDVGGVLQLGGKKRKSPTNVHISGIHEKIANALGLTMDQYFDSIDTAYAKSMEGQVSKSTLLGILSLNLNYPKDKLEKLYVNAYKKVFKKNLWLFNVAKQLKKKGYKVAVLSDQWALAKDALLPEKEFKIFDEVVVSCDVGVRKPNPAIYNLVLEKLNLKPQEVLFIDNQEWNILPAHSMGMKTVLFTSNKKLKEQLKHFAIFVK